jgi:hypothetical protein
MTAGNTGEFPESHSKKRKTIVKRSKTDKSTSDLRESGGSSQDQTVEATPEPLPNRERDSHIFIKIQERAYWLFQASGFKHGYDLEHWLEAERQVTGSSDLRAP